MLLLALTKKDRMLLGCVQMNIYMYVRMHGSQRNKDKREERKKKENWYALQRSRQHVSVLHRLTN